MTDDDFEARLTTLLNESVDRRISGSVRVAPPFSAPERSTQSTAVRRARWFLPLAIAACVAAVVTGAVVLRTVAGPDRRAPVVDHSTSVPAPKPTTVSVRLGDATVVLPVGWVARSAPGSGSPSASSNPEKQAWCLSPASLPAARAATACPLIVGTVDPKGAPLDVDVQGGYEGMPQFCSRGRQLGSEADVAQTRQFGGRSADWRSWDIRCTTGQRLQMEQYVVATDPGYVLASQTLTPAVHAAMTVIAQHSMLPAAAADLRLFDRGRVTSLTTTASGTRVTIERVYEKYDGSRTSYVDLHLPAVAYEVPAGIWARERSVSTVRRGSIAQIATNGTAVTAIIGL